MFYMNDIFGYDKDTFNRMKYINQEANAQANSFYSFIPLSNDSSNEYSQYGKKLEKRIKNLNKLHDEIYNEIREVGTRIRDLAQSGKATKTEVDLRTSKYSLFKSLIDVEKTVADLESKKEKGRMDDIKFNKDLELANLKIQAGGGNVAHQMEDRISTNDSYMNSLFSGGVDKFINTNMSAPSYRPQQPGESRIPTTNAQPYNAPEQPVSTIEESPVPKVENNTVKVQNNLNQEPIDFSALGIDTTNKSNANGYIENVNGEMVSVYEADDGLNDFRHSDKTATDASLALKNMEIKRNPNAKEFFKYNKEQGMGWMVWLDTETNQEIEGGTHIDLKLLYPIDIDTNNNIANTRLQESYPVMYTDESPSEKVIKDYEMMRTIEKNKEAKKEEEEI